MRPTGLLVLGITLGLTSVGEAAPDIESGNFMLPHCEHFVEKKSNDVWDGECVGAISALVVLGKELPDGFKNCLPKDVTRQQAARVIVKYMRSNPEKLHDSYIYLATTALSKAWPCK